MILSVLTFFTGVILLYVGAEGLVRGAIHIAKSLAIRPVVIGLTMVAFGTSAPEFIVSLISALGGNSDIALGNVVGSNIANIGLILGIAAFIRPVDIDKQSLIIYYPVLLISSALLYLFALRDAIGFIQGVFLLFGIAAFTWYLINKTDKEPVSDRVAKTGIQEAQKRNNKVKPLHVLYIVAGVLLLVGGSHLMVESGVAIARALGISEFVIGVTLVAVGTSLPELAATIVSVVKRNTGIILGNIIGSNIFNILFVIGGVSVIQPIFVEASSRVFEFPVMIAFSIILFIFMRSGFAVNRTEGIILLAGYFVFLAFLF